MVSTNHSSKQQPPIGVLVMAYGTPSTPEQIEAYYTHIRHGRKPTPELLADLQGRYQAIGGVSPLLKHTKTQVNGIQKALDALAPNRFRTILGMKHASPFIEESATQLAQEEGIREVIGLVLAPHYSRMSVGEYIQRAQKALPESVSFTAVTSWHLEPEYIHYVTEQIQNVKARMLQENDLSEDQLEILFTAHSLPQRILSMGDPYPTQLKETAEAVAQAAQLQRWSVAWQSAGRTADPWIGPDILEVIQTLVTKGTKGVIVAPVGFVSDHLEVLYDLDIEASQLAATLNLAFARTQLPNNDARIFNMLAKTISSKLEELRKNGAR